MDIGLLLQLVSAMSERARWLELALARSLPVFADLSLILHFETLYILAHLLLRRKLLLWLVSLLRLDGKFLDVRVGSGCREKVWGLLPLVSLFFICEIVERCWRGELFRLDVRLGGLFWNQLSGICCLESCRHCLKPSSLDRFLVGLHIKSLCFETNVFIKLAHRHESLPWGHGHHLRLFVRSVFENFRGGRWVGPWTVTFILFLIAIKKLRDRLLNRITLWDDVADRWRCGLGQLCGCTLLQAC